MYNRPVLFLGDNALEINKSAVEAERGLCQLNAHKNVFMYRSADLLVLVTFSSQCLLSQVLFIYLFFYKYAFLQKKMHLEVSS